MPNQVYEKYLEAAWSGQGADVISNPVIFLLVDGNEYTPDIHADVFLSSIPEAAIVATSQALEGKAVANKVFSSATAESGITFEAVTGDVSELLIGVQSTGTAATSRLIVKIDTATGLAATPNSSDITVFFPDGEICTL